MSSDQPNEPIDQLNLDIPMSVRRAKEVLDQNPRIIPIDDVYPWWQTLRTPFFILSGVLAFMCLAVIFLAVSVRTLSADRTQEFEEDACYDLFSSDSSEATARVRAAATRLDSAGWGALVRSVGDIPIDDDVVSDIDRLVREANEALQLDQQKIQERDAWVNEGRPLPCPIGEAGLSPEEFETTIAD